MYYKHHKKFKRKFKPPILRVPVEIRLRIYEYAFRDARIIDVTTTQRGTVQRSKGIQSLLVVNKRIRQEATKTFYRRCLFRINHFELHPKQKRLNPMTTLNSIARLEVLWSPSPRSRFTSTNNDAQFLLGLESLKEITFNLLNMQYLSIPRQDSKIELHEAMLAKWTVTFSNLPSWVERVLDARRSNLKIFLIPYFLVGPNRDADLTTALFSWPRKDVIETGTVDSKDWDQARAGLMGNFNLEPRQGKEIFGRKSWSDWKCFKNKRGKLK